jgi:hypothetical protein
MENLNDQDKPSEKSAEEKAAEKKTAEEKAAEKKTAEEKWQQIRRDRRMWLRGLDAEGELEEFLEEYGKSLD